MACKKTFIDPTCFLREIIRVNGSNIVSNLEPIRKSGLRSICQKGFKKFCIQSCCMANVEVVFGTERIRPAANTVSALERNQNTIVATARL